MALSDIALVVMIVVAAIVVVPILKREIARPSSHGLGDLAGSPEDRAVLEQADALLESDPATAQRILNDHFAKEDPREEEERAALCARANTDRTAAEELRRRLHEDLAVWETLLKSSRKKARKDVTAQQAVANLEQWDQETRAELVRVDELIKKLRA